MRASGVHLATSGLGPRNGGIGVVSEMMATALALPRRSILLHHHSLPRSVRRLEFGLVVLLARLRSPRLVIYEHVDLSLAHRFLPLGERVPYAVFLHGTEVWRPLDRGRRAALERASLLIANSRFSVDLARTYNPWLPQVTITHLGVAEIPYRPARRAEAPSALMVGRMSSQERYKGHEQVIAAWPSISRRVPGANLNIVGAGDDALRLRRLVESRPGGGSGIRFSGWLGSEQLKGLYASSTLLLQVSSREGFGLAALEAALCGTPTLGLRGCVIEEVFPDPDTVVLARSQSPQDIAEAAIPILSDARLAAEIGERARRHVEQTMLERHFADRLRGALAPWIG